MRDSLAEPDASFNHAKLRVEWANRKVSEFIRFHNLVCDKHPVKFNVSTDNNEKFMIGTFPQQSIPAEIPLMAGDIIHDLRCALDYCWMGIRRAVLGDNAKKTTIPRGSNRNEVKGTVKKASLEDAFPDLTDFICDKARLYKSGNEILWSIGQMDNWHKHNLLVASINQTSIQSLVLTSRTIKHWDITDAILSGAVNGIGARIPPDEKFEIKGEPKATLEIMIGCPTMEKRYSAIPLVTAALQDTSDLVEAFISEFGSNSPS